MPAPFQQPVSTSNLYTPDFDQLCQRFGEAFNQDGEFVSGTVVAQLEQKLCEYHQSRFAVTFSTGFWALVAAVTLKALPDKQEVIIPSLTYRRLADVVYWTGNRPVFVDIDPTTLAVCPRSVEQAVSSNTALILGVHPIVNCCDVLELLAVSQRQHVPIVFDAVESVHETIHGRRIGSFDVGEVFSFHASKLINGLEGGYVCTNDQTFKNRLVQFRDHGIDRQAPSAPSALSDPAASPALTTPTIGLNGVMNDGHAAFAIAGLEEIDANVQHNQAIYEAYIRCLQDIAGIELLSFDTTEQSSFKNIVANVSADFPVTRDQLVERLNANNILARAHYTPPLHAKSYQYSVVAKKMKNTDRISTRLINLPCGQRVSESDVRTICEWIATIATREVNPT